MTHGTSRATLAAALLACAWAGTARAQMTLTPASLDFGVVGVGTGAALTATLRNQSTTGVVAKVTGIVRCDGTSTEFSAPTGLLAGQYFEPGQTRPVTVSFQPVDGATESGCFELQFVDARYPYVPLPPATLSVAGAAIGDPIPRLAAPGGFYFGDVRLGTTATRTVALQNVGALELILDSVRVTAGTSAELTVLEPLAPVTIAPGASVPLTVTYAPADLVADSGSIELVSNDPVTPVRVVSLSGNGLDPNARLDLDITGVQVPARSRVLAPLSLSVSTVNAGQLSGSVTLEVVAEQDGVEVYRASSTLWSATGAVVEYAGYGFTPTAKGVVTWTVTVIDGDADVDVATADTRVR